MMDGVEQHFELHPATETEPKDAAELRSPGPASGAIPMTMPAILRNSGLTQANHLSYLVDHRAGASSFPPYRNAKQQSNTRSSSKDLGRRKQRRSENATLLSTNPHAVRPSAKDYRLQTNTIKSTFPTHASASKANHQLLTNLPAPSHSRVGSSRPETDPVASNYGHFGKSLKDARKVLKKLNVANISDNKTVNQTAGDLERFVWTVDRQIRLWSTEEVHVLPDAQAKQQSRKRGTVLLDTSFLPPDCSQQGEEEDKYVYLDAVQPSDNGQLIEFQRTPNALVWLVGDPFLRLVIHCLARVYGCPSFSKDDLSRPGLRFTWILNKNPLTRRKGGRRHRRASVSSSVMSSSETPSYADPLAVTADSVQTRLPVNARLGGLRQNALETPPTTDFDSQTESEIDLATPEVESELGTESDLGPHSLASSVVLVHPDDLNEGRSSVDHDVDSEDGLADVEKDGVPVIAEEEEVATDEEEADILRRVRKWALDSHRQRAQDAQTATSSSAPSHRLRHVTNAPTSEESTAPRPTIAAKIPIPEVSSEQEEDDHVE